MKGVFLYWQISYKTMVVSIILLYNRPHVYTSIVGSIVYILQSVFVGV